MALIKKVNFSGGEIDPALEDRDNFEKHKAGLRTARNVTVAKTGRLVSRAGTLFLALGSVANRRMRVAAPKNSDYFIEWGHLYVKFRRWSTGTAINVVHTYTEDNLDDLHFEFNGDFLYVFKKGSNVLKYNYKTGAAVTPVFDIPLFTGSPTWTSATTGTGTFNYEHIVTTIVNGEESFALGPATARAAPVNIGERITLTLSVAQAGECRVYRRPQGGRTFGYIGSIAAGSTTYEDFGEEADYSQTIPDYTSYFKLSTDAIVACNPKTGIVYQQRLLLGNLARNDEAIVATRTGYQKNFSRDFPLTDDSALTFKCGSSGNANVIRLFDGGPLIAFTTNGVFSNDGGPLTPDTAYMEKRAGFVISERVPPLDIPGAILFVDKATNTVRNLVYSDQSREFEGPEVSIFSDHLFRGKEIIAWTYQKGQVPIVHVVYDDQTCAYFTFQKEHEMQAWTRGDTDGEYYDCCTITDPDTNKDIVIYVTNRTSSSKYMLEYTTDRFVDDLKKLVQVDAGVYLNETLHDAVGFPSDEFSLTPVGPDGWSGVIRIDAPATSSAFSGVTVGTVYKMFDENKAVYDLTVTQLVSADSVIVTPDRELPLELRTAYNSSAIANRNFVFYNTYTTITGLNHLEGKDVSVYVDGSIIGSPLNNKTPYTVYTVVGGQITLPEPAAYVVVGLPFVVDVETLDASGGDTNISLDGRIVNNVTVKTFNSKGFSIAQNFPEGDGIAGMEEPELTSSERYSYTTLPAEIKNYNVMIPNDWNSKGRVCIRSVDPVGLEIITIQPDLIVPN